MINFHEFAQKIEKVQICNDYMLEEYNEKITDVLIMIGLNNNVQGFNCYRIAVLLCVNDPNYFKSFTKLLYPKIGELLEMKPSNVERSLRHSMEIIINKGKLIKLNEVFGKNYFTVYEKLSSSELIAFLAEKIPCLFKKDQN